MIAPITSFPSGPSYSGSLQPISPGVQQMDIPVSAISVLPGTSKLALATPSTAGSFGNSIAIFNPETGQIENTTFIGSEPSMLAPGRTPPAWQQHLREEANNLNRTARVETAQQASFDDIIRKLKGTTSMISVKVWCEGSTDRPIFRKLFTEIGETEIADTLDFVGGWANLLSEHEPGRWLDGCRTAVIIMDGDEGRKLSKPKRPLTKHAKDLQRRFAQHPLKLQILHRYGIENYLPRRAYEAVLGRGLSAYFPIPDSKKLEDHFREPQPFWQRLFNCLRGQKQPSFYQKKRNEQVAAHLTMADISGTDLADIISEVHTDAEAARKY